MAPISVAVDIDGVLCDMMPTALKMIAKHVDAPELADKKVTAWDWEIRPGLYFSEGLRDTMRADSSWLAGLPEVEMAQWGMKALTDRGYKVDIITSRKKEWVEEATRLWVETHFPGYELYHESNGKCMHDHDVMVDDRPKYVAEFSQHNRYGILFDQPWNRDYRCGFNEARAYGWLNVVRIVDYMNKCGRLKELRVSRHVE